jgi:hypothetical protein
MRQEGSALKRHEELMMNRPSLALLTLLGGTALAALAGSFSCGGSDSNGGSAGGGTYTSSLPGSKSIGDLTDSDRASLCQSTRTYYGSSSGANELGCKVAGLFAAVPILFRPTKTDADLQKACGDAYANCEAMPSSSDAGTAATCAKPTGTCTATVAEYEACVTDQSAQLASSSANIPACGTLTVAGIQGSLEAGVGTTTPAATPSSCQTLYTKCPGLTM